MFKNNDPAGAALAVQKNVDAFMKLIFQVMDEVIKHLNEKERERLESDMRKELNKHFAPRSNWFMDHENRAAGGGLGVRMETPRIKY